MTIKLHEPARGLYLPSLSRLMDRAELGRGRRCSGGRATVGSMNIYQVDCFVLWLVITRPGSVAARLTVRLADGRAKLKWRQLRVSQPDPTERHRPPSVARRLQRRDESMDDMMTLSPASAVYNNTSVSVFEVTILG